MTTETMSVAAYARTHDASRQAATKWQERGYLVMRDGAVDVAASDGKMKAAGKGRFRAKAHGGRRTAGERGLIDRPALGYVGGQPTAAASPSSAIDRKDGPWTGWAWAGNADNPLSKTIQELLDIGDDEAAAEIVHIVDYSEWENACTYVGWDQWPASIAATIAGEIGADPVALEAALHRHVRARILTLDIEPVDLVDPRLDPR